MKEKNIGFEIKSINDLILKKMLHEAKKRNNTMISPTQIRIMHYLYDNNDKIIYQRDIEKLLQLKRSTVSGIIKTMEKNNIVKRKEVTNDMRLKQIFLTDEAYLKMNDIKKIIAKFSKTLEKDISKDDLKIFYKVTNQIKKNINIEEE